VLPVPDHCHCARVAFAAVLGVHVIQHRFSGERAGISDVSVEVSDALRMSAGKTQKDHLTLFSTDVVHNC
jgi:hypothetical protein